MQEIPPIRNREWMASLFVAQRESANWFAYKCTLCPWGKAANQSARRSDIEGQCAVHLVLRHVDLGELRVD